VYTVHDKLSCTRLQNYTTGASLMLEPHGTVMGFQLNGTVQISVRRVGGVRFIPSAS